MFLELAYPKGCFGKIKKNSIFCECLSILDILRKWLLIRELNRKENVTFKMTSQSLKLLSDYSDSFKGPTIRKVMGGGVGKNNKKKIHARENVRKKFMQGKMSEKKIHAQDGPHFDMKP